MEEMLQFRGDSYTEQTSCRTRETWPLPTGSLEPKGFILSSDSAMTIAYDKCCWEGGSKEKDIVKNAK